MTHFQLSFFATYDILMHVMIKKAKNLVVESSKDILGGELVFKGTRVPVRTLIDYLEAGESFKDFLKDFPTVKKTQVIDILENFKRALAKG